MRNLHQAALQNLLLTWRDLVVEWLRKSFVRSRAFFVEQRLSAILIVIGLALLGYVGHEYWAMHREQQALRRQWLEQ
jgi:hypothetical protein